MDKNKDLTFEETLKLAIDSQKKNKLDIAQDLYNKVLEVNPNHIATNMNLGLIFNNSGKLHEAKNCFEKVIKLEKGNVDAYNKLGLIFKTLGENQKALNTFVEAINIYPNNANLLNSLLSFFENIQITNANKADKEVLKKIFLHLIKKNSISMKLLTSNIKSLLFSNSEINELLKFTMSESLFENQNIQILLKEELLHLMLQRFLINDNFFENLFTKLRSEMLSLLNNTIEKNLEEYFDFTNSLAEQCWLNEYVYPQSEKEINNINILKKKIENDKEINELEIAVLACYIPLYTSKSIIKKLSNYKSTNILFNDLINVQIKEPLKELTLAKSIKSLDKINDSVSKKVKTQYEEHPYPRWRSFIKYMPYNFNIYQNSEINPNKIELDNKFNNPNVLIAGCGTGRHLINTLRYKNANILGVDLSLASLSYAKRKIEELGLKNIELLNTDILHLNKLNKKFDIIESIGTLHHMEDPIKGLRVLLDTLEPHGFLKLGLYSQTARQGVIKVKEFIKKENLGNSIEDIRVCRKAVINQKEDPFIRMLSLCNDFYSTSGVRDLFFNIQEHRFTIPEIANILKTFNLEFLGFTFTSEHIKNRFSKAYPGDKSNISLDNWHQFELKNPEIFFGMYKFWVRKNQN